MSKILSINISNVCIDVAEEFELDDVTIYNIADKIRNMFSDSTTLRHHITTIYDDETDILYHVQDGQVTHSQDGGAKILDKLEEMDVE